MGPGKSCAGIYNGLRVTTLSGRTMGQHFSYSSIDKYDTSGPGFTFLKRPSAAFNTFYYRRACGPRPHTIKTPHEHTLRSVGFRLSVCLSPVCPDFY